MTTFAIPAAAGALSVEPTIWLHQLLAGFMPDIMSGLPSSFVYALTGLFGGALVKMFGPKFGLTTQMSTQLATAVASAAGGVAYYKARTEGMAVSVTDELDGLALAGVSPLGFLATDNLSGLALAGAVEMSPYFGDPGSYQVFPAQGMHVY